MDNGMRLTVATPGSTASALKDRNISRKPCRPRGQETSLSIQEKKMNSIKKNGASIVVTACPGCMIQLIDGIRWHEMEVEVVHVAQLL